MGFEGDDPGMSREVRGIDLSQSPGATIPEMSQAPEFWDFGRLGEEQHCGGGRGSLPGAHKSRGAWQRGLGEGCIICDNWAFLQDSGGEDPSGESCTTVGLKKPGPRQGWWLCWGDHRTRESQECQLLPMAQLHLCRMWQESHLTGSDHFSGICAPPEHMLLCPFINFGFFY